jgi:hypothetical protein
MVVSLLVIPAKAGTPLFVSPAADEGSGTPAFAGVTRR